MLIKLIPENEFDDTCRLIPYLDTSILLKDQTFKLLGTTYKAGGCGIVELLCEPVEQNKEVKLRDKLNACIQTNYDHGGNRETLVDLLITVLKENDG